MQKRNFYLTILVFGAVFAFLALIVRESREEALTIAFLTLFVIFFLRLVDEYLYFRSSRAAYATGLFVFIPGALAIGSSLIATISPWLADNMLYGQIYLTIVRPKEYTFFVNTFSVLFALPFFAVAAYIILQYSQRNYRTAYFARKRLPGRFAGFFYSMILIGGTVSCWIYFSAIEITSAVFVAALTMILLYYYVWEAFNAAIPSFSYPSQNRSSSNSRSRSIQASHRQPGINSSTQESWGQSAASSAQPLMASTAAARPNSPPAARVSPGIESSSPSRNSFRTRPAGRVTTSTKTGRSQNARSPTLASRNKGKLANLLPTGQAISEDDFRCIFCYELPEKSTSVVICPYCKRPAHLAEF
ncbi:MAG: hypothetical protein ACXAB4_10595, partial [Candidatus Hodarchaeales archaeon]